MSGTLDELYRRDLRVWDSCAVTYEQAIVKGHPDVTAYEAFEEDLLDRVLQHLMREKGRRVHLYDLGCGSARLHLRYGLKSFRDDAASPEDLRAARQARLLLPGSDPDPFFAQKMAHVGGIDFSGSMVDLARRKIVEAGLSGLDGRLSVDKGSAFEMSPMPADPLPVVVSVCNSVGVMQGPEGAASLFRSVRNAVEKGGGVGIISGYRKEAVATHALGNYESTMNVCGQPRWLVPDTYAASSFLKVPRAYKRAYDPDPTVTVDVLDMAGKTAKEGFVLERDPVKTRETVETGHILTHTDYESRWYAFEQFDRWISELWPKGKGIHLAGRDLDAFRGAPAQVAVLDMEGNLADLLARWSGPEVIG